MENLWLVVSFFLVGVICRWLGLTKEVGQSLAKVVVFVTLPCLTLLTVHKLELNLELLVPTVAIWVTILAGVLCFGVLGRVLRLPRPMIGALIMGGAFSNTSFVGIPIVTALAGGEYVGLAIWIDQAGTYLALSTVGLLVAIMMSPDAAADGFSMKTVCGGIAAFPPFWAMIVALLLKPFEYPDLVGGFLSMGADTLVPIAMIAVGLQLDVKELEGKWVPLGAALVFGLFVAPGLILSLFVAGGGIDSPEIKVTILEAAMGPQIGASVVAMRYGLEPGLMAGIVGIGIPMSLATTYGWWWMVTGPIGL